MSNNRVPLRQATTSENEIGLLAACWMDDDNTKILLSQIEERDFSTGTGQQQLRVLKKAWVEQRSSWNTVLKKISVDLGFIDSYQNVSDAKFSEDGMRNWTGIGPGYMQQLIDQVRQESARVRMARALRAGLESLADPDRTLGQVQDSIAADLASACSTARRHTAIHEREALESLAQELREQATEKKEGKPSADLPTGIPELDRVTGGLGESELIILAARPRVGKTALASLIARNVAKTHGPVLFFTLELSVRKMARRIACQELGLPLTQLRPDEVDEVAALRARNLWLDDEPVRPDQILRRVELFRLSHPNLKAVFLDHLGILAGPAADYRATSYASNMCRDAMKRTGLPFVVLVQIGRAAEKRDGGRPELADLKMSGCIEEDARKVILLHRPPLYRPKGQGDPFEAVAIVAKNGDGEEGDVALHYNGPTFTFSEAPEDRKRPEQLSFPTYNPPEMTDIDIPEDMF